MKKVPSYPKITTKTNITVTQTQNININSPKGIGSKKMMFKPDSKKNLNSKNNQSIHNVKEQLKKSTEYKRKSSKKFSKIQEEKQLKKSKSQEELMVLSEKLKRLEDKIKILKAQEKKEKSDISVRSTSKKRSNNSKNKEIPITSAQRDGRKFQIFKAKTNKVLKKAYSQKLALRNKEKQINEEAKKSPKEEKLLQEFVTQVPIKQSMDLKQSVERSLRRKASEPQQYSFENIQEMYYIEQAIKALSKASLYGVREHLTQSMQTLQFLQNIRKPTLKQLQKQSVELPAAKFPQTIVLDLDQTLIHCNQTLSIPHDVSLSIKFPTGQKIDAGVNVRPFALKFLEQLSKMCEIIVFTASHECYANVVLNYLDPKKKFISHRLFREHCWQTQEGIYIKDLRVLKNRSLENVLLVDNAAYSYFYQLQNGIPILPYYDDKSDHELFTLLQYIKGVLLAHRETKKSIRKINSEYFKLDKYFKYQDLATLTQELYGNVLKMEK